MTMRLTGRSVAVALVLGLTVPAMAGAFTMPRVAAVKENAKEIKENAKENVAVAPRFDPELPTKLDEFVPVADASSIHFDFDRAVIRPRDAVIVDHGARWLKANAPYDVVIEGYADERGSKPYNVALAKRRAMAVRNALVARGVQPDRITMVSFGEARRECRLSGEPCWSQNRRADILVRRLVPQSP